MVPADPVRDCRWTARYLVGEFVNVVNGIVDISPDMDTARPGESEFCWFHPQKRIVDFYRIVEL
jgi:hypothetical protein